MITKSASAADRAPTRVDLIEIALHRLAYFAAVADTGSFREAARRLRVAQPGLSAHVRSLERYLGVELFVRSGRGVILTALGKQLLPRVRELLAAADRLVEYSVNLSTGEQGVISVACYPVHLERFLSAVVGEFKREHPRIRIDLTKVRDDRRRKSGRSLFDELVAGDVDIALGPPQPLLRDRLEGVKIYDAKIVLAVPNDHPARHAPEISVEELRTLPLLIAPPEFYSRERVEAACREAGFTIAVEAQSSSPPALLALGKHGVGVPVLPDDYSLVGRQEFPFPVIVGLDGLELSTPVWAHWRRDELPHPAAQLFREYVGRWAEAERTTPGVAAVKL